MKENSIQNILVKNPLVPVVSFQKDDEPEQLMNYLLEQNIFCIEITLRTEYGLKAIERLKKEYGGTVAVGAGTVIHPDQVKQLKEVGTDFIVSPGLTEQLFESISKAEISFLPGVSTASEMIRAKEMGFEYLKFFPAELFGGVNALKMYGGLFPDLKFCPTGGISEKTYKKFLELQNVIAVGGSWLQKDFNRIKG